SPPAAVPRIREGNLRTSHAASGAATTPPISSPSITRESSSFRGNAHRNPMLAATVTVSSDAATEPTTLRGPNLPEDNSVVVPIGPQPPPPVASTKPAINPRGARKRTRNGCLPTAFRNAKNAKRNNTYVPIRNSTAAIHTVDRSADTVVST